MLKKTFYNMGEILKYLVNVFYFIYKTWLAFVSVCLGFYISVLTFVEFVNSVFSYISQVIIISLWFAYTIHFTAWIFYRLKIKKIDLKKYSNEVYMKLIRDEDFISFKEKIRSYWNWTTLIGMLLIYLYSIISKNIFSNLFFFTLGSLFVLAITRLVKLINHPLFNKENVFSIFYFSSLKYNISQDYEGQHSFYFLLGTLIFIVLYLIQILLGLNFLIYLF
jgi:hypothetical protein